MIVFDFFVVVEDRFEKITCDKIGAVNLLPLMMAQMIQSELIWVIKLKAILLGSYIHSIFVFQMCPQQNLYNSSKD